MNALLALAIGLSLVCGVVAYYTICTQASQLRDMHKRIEQLSKNYTCYNCKDRMNCKYAWHGSNLHGRCVIADNDRETVPMKKVEKQWN